MNQKLLKIYIELLEEQLKLLDSKDKKDNIDKSTSDLIIALQSYLKEHNLI